MTPIVNGRLYQFAAYGLYDGLFLMGDHETISYWNHITGECLYGELKGAQLTTGMLHYLTASQTVAAYPEAQIAISTTLKWWQRLFSHFQRWTTGRDQGFLPPGFSGTMGQADSRRSEMDMGLGVWSEQIHRYYPLNTIQKEADGLIDELNGRSIKISIDPISNTPTAIYQETDAAKPNQLFTRWYGFAYTFPHCEIYEDA